MAKQPTNLGKVRKALETSGLCSTTTPGSIGQAKDGSITVRKEYYWGINGGEAWAGKVLATLSNAGVLVSLVNAGNHFTSFKGGKGVKANSHYWVTFRVL